MSRMKGLPLLLLLLASCLLFGAREAHACSCGPKPTVLDQYEWADVVVVVRVVSVEKTEKAAPEGRMSDGTNYVNGVMSTRTVVERNFKGSLKAGDEMIFAQGGGGDCIWTFDDENVGQKYLFYLKRFNDSNRWVAVTCGRSRHFEAAQDDLLYLDRLDKVRGKTRFSGTVRSESWDGLAGHKLRITGADGKTLEVRTDEHGVYEIYDLPAGKYAVETDPPAGRKLVGYWLRYSPSVEGADDEKRPKKIFINLEAGKHAGLDLMFEIDNAVRGKIYDPNGTPMNGVCLKLEPADGSKGAFLLDCTETGGAFEIDDIPPGRYVLAVNEDDEITSSEPFRKFYYPNAARREEATVFQIGAGDFVDDLRVYAPQAAETITVEGLFLYSDGQPVANEWVEYHEAGKDAERESDARAKTDAKGRFTIRILKGQEGQLSGRMYTFSREFENCPKLKAALKQTSKTFTKLKTPPHPIRADADQRGVELRYPFPGCKKAKIE